LGALPSWIEQRNNPFYADGESIERVTPVAEYINEEIWERSDSNLSVANEDQLLLKLQSKNNVITGEFLDDLLESINKLENEDFSSMVIYAGGNNLSVGANLYQMKKAHEENQVVSEVGAMVEKLHYIFSRLKHALKPV